MKLVFILFVAFIMAAVVSRMAESSSVRVPQDVASIQAALEGTADTVLVSAGTYPERLTLSRDVVVLGPEVAAGDPPAAVVLGATITFLDHGNDHTFMLRGIRWIGGVGLGAIQTTARASFVSCWFDSGASGGGSDEHFVAFRECRLFGSITGAFRTLDVADCRFERAGIDVFAAGPLITRNIIEGPAPNGIAVRGPPSINWAIRDNQVRKVGVGISMNEAIFGVIERNLVEDCQDLGIRVTHTTGSPVRHNHVRRCRGVGIAMTGLSVCDSNIVEHCGGDGIVAYGFLRGNQVQFVDGYGIHVADFAAEFKRNTVLHARRDGVFVDEVLLEASSNVIGSCGGHGFNTKGMILMTQNTLFANRGSGILIRSTPPEIPVTVRANIVVANRRYGLECSGTSTGPWELGCNDWFMNKAGATLGVPTSSSDLFVDPRFCGAGHGDVRLRDSSPLASIACGPLGAADVGCAEGEPGGSEIVTDPDPIPIQRPALRESAPRVLLAAGAPGRPSLVMSLAVRTELDVTAYDLQGRIVAKMVSGTFEPGLHEFGLQPGVPAGLRSGVYFVRVAWPGGSSNTRLVLRR